MKNKLAIVLVVVLCAVSVLVLVGGKEKVEEVIELTFWNQWNDPGLRKAGDELLRRWAAENPSIQIEERILPEATAEELIRNAFASGAPPDIMCHENHYDLYKWADLGMIGDLTDFFQKYGDRFPEASKPYSWHNGRAWSAPHSLITLAHIYYNKDILTKYNIGVPSDWDSFINAMEILKKEGVIPMALGVKTGWPGLHWFQLFACETVGADTVNAVLARTKKGQAPKWTDPGFVKAAEYYESLFDRGYVSKGAGMLEYDSAKMQFFGGKAGFFFTGSWFEQLDPPPDLNWGVIPFPDIPGEPMEKRMDRPIFYLIGYAYSKECKHPEAAVEFIEFLTRKENAKLAFTIGKNLPATLGAVEYDELNEAQKMYWNLAVKATGAIPPIETWINPEAGFGEMYNGATGIATGIITPEEWMQRIEDAQQLALE